MGFGHFSKKEKMTLYVPIGKLAKPVPFQGTDTGSNPVGGTRPKRWTMGFGDILQVKLLLKPVSEDK